MNATITTRAPAGYVPMKQWRFDQATRLGIAPITVAGRIHHGKLKLPQTIRKNKRVVWVYQINEKGQKI